MLSDSIQNILAAPAGILVGHTYELTDGVVDFGDDLSIDHVKDTIAAAQSVIEGSANVEKPPTTPWPTSRRMTTSLLPILIA